MDVSRATEIKLPSVRAKYAPVYWEPLTGSGERICAIVLVAPELGTSTMLTPAAHVIINARRLRAMLGAERAESVQGILAQAADFMRQRLFAGADISECSPPFHGFTVGRERRARGFTAEQVLDAAVRTVSAFGSADDLLEEAGELANHSTATTREFLARVQTAFAPADDARRQRFLRPVHTHVGDITIDYVHERNLVQFASAPTTPRQAQNMRREAESKILETLTVQRTVMEGQGRPVLVVNRMPLLLGGASDAAMDLASSAMAHYARTAKLYGLTTAEAGSHEEAVRILASLG